MTVYTLGLWRVKEHEVEDFVSAWRQMAGATKAAFPEASAVLLQDREDAQLFISFGPWESAGQIEEWRSSSAFTEGVAGIRPHLHSFDPHSMDVVISIE